MTAIEHKTPHPYKGTLHAVISETMSVFTEPEFRFTTHATGKIKNRVVSCQASNSLIITYPNGIIRDVVTADFKMPQGMVISNSTGKLFVVDRYNGCVKVFEKIECDITISHARSLGEGQLNQPVGIALDQERDELYVADNENHRVVAYKTDGTLLLTLGRGYGQEPGQMFCPCGVAFYKNLVIVAEWGNGRLQVFRDGKSILVINGMPHAHDVVINENGEGFVALYSHKQVAKFKITFNDDQYPCFELSADKIQLEHSPTSLFFDEDGKLGVVTKTKLMINVH